MQWLDTVVNDLIARHPAGEILIESGGSPSGSYHLGHLRELVVCDAIYLALKKRGREVRHVYFVDDMDALRKVPKNVPADYEQYLRKPLCDIPSPQGGDQSYADYFLAGLQQACTDLGIEVSFIRAHEKYRSGYFVPVIERCLDRLELVRKDLEEVSKRSLGEDWSPLQIMDHGYLKNRAFVSIDVDKKTLCYRDAAGETQTTRYDQGAVKLDWRVDWPGRWWLMQVAVEPFGREHASAGGSYDTGVRLMQDVYEAPAPLPVAYDSIHMIGDTKKMSASKGTALSATESMKFYPQK